MQLKAVEISALRGAWSMAMFPTLMVLWASLLQGSSREGLLDPGNPAGRCASLHGKRGFSCSTKGMNHGSRNSGTR